MDVAIDEQIFAVQRYGGISRMFAELLRAFGSDESLGVKIRPLDTAVVNRYVLDDAWLRASLHLEEAANPWTALARYFSTIKPRSSADVVHNTFYLPHGLPLTRGQVRVVTIHDMIPELMPRTRRRLDLITMKHRYVRAADHIICVSDATRRDLLSIYPDVQQPVTVVHHGVDPRFFDGGAPPANVPDRYVLFVGQRGQYKDATTLMEALALIRDVRLHAVFVGGGGWTNREQRTITRLGLSRRIHHFDLADDQMPGAYAHAQAFVLPSHYEGFGLPVIEAMAAGTPAILARASALPEVGGEAAIYFEPGDAVDLGKAIESTLADQAFREDVVGRGHLRARTFSWQRAARETSDVYRQALESVGVRV